MKMISFALKHLYKTYFSGSKFYYHDNKFFLHVPTTEYICFTHDIKLNKIYTGMHLPGAGTG